MLDKACFCIFCLQFLMRQPWIKIISFYNIYYAVQPDLPKQLFLLQFHFFTRLEILLRDTDLFTGHFLRLPAYIDLRDVGGSIERVTFEGGLLDIGIESADSTHTEFIVTYDVRQHNIVIQKMAEIIHRGITRLFTLKVS